MIILIKAVVFDFGGVYFTYSRERRLKAFKKLKKPEKLLDIAWEKYIDDYNRGKLSEAEFWKKFKGVLEIEVSNKKLREITLSIFKPIKCVHKIVKELRKKFKVGLLTDQTNWLDILDKKYGIYKNFDEIVISCRIGAIKPEKKMYLAMLKKLKVKPSEVVFVDDDMINVKAAEKLGMKVILFKNCSQLRRELKRLGVL